MKHLYAEHAQIREIGAKLMVVLDGDVPSDPGELAQLRLAMSRAVNVHFANEDGCMGKALWDPSGSNAAVLSDWALKRQELRTLYSEHLHDWPLSNVLTHWAEYRKAVLERLKASDIMMRWEEAEIYKLAV